MKINCGHITSLNLGIWYVGAVSQTNLILIICLFFNIYNKCIYSFFSSFCNAFCLDSCNRHRVSSNYRRYCQSWLQSQLQTSTLHITIYFKRLDKLFHSCTKTVPFNVKYFHSLIVNTSIPKTYMYKCK